MQVPVAARSEARAFVAWMLRAWVRIPLKAWMLVLVCCVFLWKWSFCDGLNTRPRRNPYCTDEQIKESSRVRGGQDPFMDCGATEEGRKEDRKHVPLYLPLNFPLHFV
jgi:hypothetical protein